MSIDLSLENIWKTWFEFRKGKRFTSEFHSFQYHLERELYKLYRDLNSGTYQHGIYRKLVVSDNKRREISVAGIRDRIVHRLVYNYLTPIYNHTFSYDAWSCRVGKGLLGAIERTQQFIDSYPDSYVWKGDVRKFFDSVDQPTLLGILSRKITDEETFNPISKIITGFSSDQVRRVGMPIGNLTSQIFANIYLNELDRYVQHILRPVAYLRYGDDFVLIHSNLQELQQMQASIKVFLQNRLKLVINRRNHLIIKSCKGLKFLGVQIWPSGRALNTRNISRIHSRLNPTNIAGYSGIISRHGSHKQRTHFKWEVYEKIADGIEENSSKW